MIDLSKLDLRVKQLALELVKRAPTYCNVNIIITQAYRSIEIQNELYAQGRTKPGKIVTNAKGGTSYHNYGLAFDIAVMNKDGKTVNWSDICDTDHDNKKDYYEIGALGKSIGLEWGGDFKSIIDIPHFQLTYGLSIKDLQKGKRPKGAVKK